jgi:hypothetical protein
MLGNDAVVGCLFGYVDPEKRVLPDQPLRANRPSLLEQFMARCAIMPRSGRKYAYPACTD